MRSVKFVILFLLLSPFCIAQQFPSLDTSPVFAEKQRENRHIFSFIAPEKHISTAELMQLKKQMQLYGATLEKKLVASDKDTRMVFAPVLLKLKDIINSPDSIVLPDEDRYRKIEKIMHDIKENMIMAFAYAELLNPNSTPLASILPDKGHGSTYILGEHVRFAVTASTDCFVQIFFVSTHNDKGIAVLRPLMFHPEPGKSSVRLTSGDTLILGEDRSFTVEPPYGNELILVVAAKQPLKPHSPSDRYPLSFPLDPTQLLFDIYGENDTDTLSIHSCFIVSKPRK